MYLIIIIECYIFVVNYMYKFGCNVVLLMMILVGLKGVIE